MTQKSISIVLKYAFGISTGTKDLMKVSWDQFIDCKCTLDLRTLTKDQKKSLWIKLIRGLSVFGNNIPKHNIYEFFEGLSRGTGGENPS